MKYLNEEAMVPPALRTSSLLQILTGLSLAGFAVSAQAVTTVSTCTEAGFDAALASTLATNDNMLLFNCPAPNNVISLTNAKGLAHASLTIDGANTGGAPEIVFTRALPANSRNFTVTNAAGNIIFKNLSINNGNAPGGGGLNDGNGGGILHLGGLLTLNNVDMSGNLASGAGGAVYSDGNGTLNIIGGSRIGHTALANGNSAGRLGGGVAIEGSVVNANKVSTISGSSIEFNQITGNGAQGGGGLGVLYNQPNFTYTVNISSSSISNNRAIGGQLPPISVIDGGGILISSRTDASNQPRASLNISTSSINQNQAGQFGGGISSDGGSVTITQSQINGNTAGFANGGLDNATGRGARLSVASTAALMSVTISTVSGNSDTANGNAGVSSFGAGATLTLTNSTVAFNIDTNGSGRNSGTPATTTGVNVAVDGGATVTLRNTIISNKSNNGGVGVNCGAAGGAGTGGAGSGGGTLAAAGISLDDDGSCAGLVGVPASFVGGGPVSGLAALSNGAHQPMAGSAAIDAASNTICPAVDQNNAARPTDGNGDGNSVCDIGAIEVATVVVAQCADGVDNDADGLIDLADPGCANAADNDETNLPPSAQCADGIDNDADGLIDLADPGCSNAADNSEANIVVPPVGIGGGGGGGSLSLLGMLLLGLFGLSRVRHAKRLT